MHFTIERRRLIGMLRVLRGPLPVRRPKSRRVRLYACAARVFAEEGGTVAGEEALVLREGGCTVRLIPLLASLRSLAGRRNVTIEVLRSRLRLAQTELRVTGSTRQVQPPANFPVGRVTDTWIVPPKT